MLVRSVLFAAIVAVPTARLGSPRKHRPEGRPRSLGSPAPACPATFPYYERSSRSTGGWGRCGLRASAPKRSRCRHVEILVRPGVLTQCRFKLGGLAIHGVANLAVRRRIGGNRIHRVLRSASEHRQHDKAVPAVDFLGRGKSPPCLVAARIADRTYRRTASSGALPRRRSGPPPHAIASAWPLKPPERRARSAPAGDGASHAKQQAWLHRSRCRRQL
jgi:hypothetical protein